MKLRPNYHLPAAQQKQLKRAMTLEWVTIGALITITAVMYFTMGSSQAMRTAWIEDVLSLVPPISFLVAMRFRNNAPTPEYPYGYRRVTLLSFLIASVAILVLALYMIYDSAMSLITQERPTLGHFNFFGWYLWSGWVMIAALIYSMIPPIILGHMKLPLAQKLREKTLHADATMNKDDWLTAGAAIIGILGIGMGWWWADAVAAGFISLEVLSDGITNVRQSVSDLMDQRPTVVGSNDPLDIDTRICERVRQMSGVIDADVRLREDGHLISGELFVVLADNGRDNRTVVNKVKAIAEAVRGIDWRLYNFVVMPVASLEE
jgi:cation diffusion facilitator family transporter